MKICINENTKVFEQQIKSLEQRAENITALLKSYNLLPVMEPLKTASQVKDFLSKPVPYFNNAILKDTGITFSKKATPSPDQVAKLFNIPYDAICRQIGGAKIGTLDFFILNEETMTMELDETKLPAIRESFREYLSDPEETAQYLEVQKLCSMLNNYCNEYKIHSTNRHQISPNLSLRYEIMDSGKEWEFKPDVRVIRHKIKKS